MQKLIIILSILILGLFSRANGQTNYNSEMQNALTEFSTAYADGSFEKAAADFDKISKSNPDNWLPLYYSMLSRTLKAFSLEPEEAVKVSGKLEKDYDKLIEMNPDMSETLTLRALFRTVKVAKDPMNYGMVLPSAIIADYNEAIKINPENPRPLYLLGQFNMRSAPYYGTDPVQYCPMIKKAKQLYANQSVNDFEPDWGEKNTDEILETECVE